MTSADAPRDGTPGRGGRAHTLPLQSLANRATRTLMRIPLLSRGIGKQLVTLYVTGRSSGRRYSIPVAYIEHQGRLLIGSPFPWTRNLRTGEPVDVRYKGQRRTADVEVVRDETAVIEYYGLMCRANRTFANFNQIAMDDGTPLPADLEAAWRSGACAILLTLR